jgi:hypothetical protein
LLKVVEAEFPMPSLHPWLIESALTIDILHDQHSSIADHHLLYVHGAREDSRREEEGKREGEREIGGGGSSSYLPNYQVSELHAFQLQYKAD